MPDEQPGEKTPDLTEHEPAATEAGGPKTQAWSITGSEPAIGDEDSHDADISDSDGADATGAPTSAADHLAHLRNPKTGQIDTEALPLTQAYNLDDSGAVAASDGRSRHAADTMTPDLYTGAVPIGEAEPARPVKVPGDIRFLKRWALILILVAAWIPATVLGLLLYQNWFVSLLPQDRQLAVTCVLGWVFICVVGALLLAMADAHPWVVALSFAVLTGPAISVAAAGVKYGYVACTAPEIPGVHSLCPEPLRGWGKQLVHR